MAEPRPSSQPPGDYSAVRQVEAEDTASTRQPSPITSSHTARGPGRRLFRRQIAWRFMNVVVFCALLVVVLNTFAKLGNLSRGQKRGFNTLTILFSAIVSLSLGSLLGLLGGMLRWPLLAWEEHKPRDADMILRMTSPTGSLKLIWRHATNKEGRWTKTTSAVALYLLLNILGRFSIATLGLAYSLNEMPRMEYPAVVPDWGSELWYNSTRDPAYDDTNIISINYFTGGNWNLYATLAQSTFPAGLMFWGPDPRSYDMRNISGRGLDRTVEGSNLTYSYGLKEYRNSEELPATGTVLRSSATCVGREVLKEEVYEKGEQIGTLHDDDTEGRNSSNLEFIPVARTLCSIFPERIGKTGIISLWAVVDPNSYTSELRQACSTSYLWQQDYDAGADPDLACLATFYECTTCLRDQDGRPAPDTALFRRYPSLNSSTGAGHLLRFGGLADRKSGYQHPGVGGNSTLYYTPYVASYTGTSMQFIDVLDTTLTGPGIWPKTAWGLPLDAELHAAHLAARLPILVVMGAEMRLPRVAKEDGEMEHQVVDVVLDVRWDRVAGVLGAIVAGQALAITATVFCCRRVILHDHDSFFPIARLLKTAMGHVPGGSVDSGAEIAARIEAAGKRDDSMEGRRMRYGTRSCGDGVYEVDLWDDVKNDFPRAMYR